MNLIVDAGNTFVKLAVFKNGAIIFGDSFEVSVLSEKVKEIFGQFPQIDWAIVSSVVHLKKKGIGFLRKFCKVHQLSHQSKIPFKNLYTTPDTLGVDRIALATAAYYHKPKDNTLVIDAGTCITYDFINREGEYLGGGISPGLSMRYKALNQQTSKLPLLTAENPQSLIGNTTELSIHSGVVNGVCAEIDGLIEQYKSKNESLTVILTGGDMLFLSKRLKNTIFANPKFLLEGLNYLLDYNIG